MERLGGKQDLAGMIMYKKDMEISLSPKIGKFIPNDLIVEILSWLPIKSLLKFKCVCKSWKIIIQDHSFIQKHRIRSKCFDWYGEKSESNGNKETFRYEHASNGLVLEESEKTGQYRIRNPATKQVLEVLDDPEERGRFRRLVMNLDSSTNNCKLISLHYKKETTDLGFKMLTVGTDHAWRPLDISLLDHKNGRLIIEWEFSTEVYYIISLCKAQAEKTEIIRLDLEAESFMKIKISPGFQSCGDEFQMFSWDKKLSLGFIIDQELHVWVLENFEKHTWSKKMIIPLDFLKRYPFMSKDLSVYGASKGLLSIVFPNGTRLKYDIDSKVLYRDSQGKKVLSGMVPSLVSLKGMHTEDISPCPVSLQEMHLEAAIKPNLLVKCIEKIRVLWASRRNYLC